jgi:lipoprotein-anchoring transpeptidase ErfK/SrfK
VITRRFFAASLAGWTLGGCAAQNPKAVAIAPNARILAAENEMFAVEPVDLTAIDPRYWRQLVANRTGEAAGTIVVDPDARFLWLVMENDMAMRYGVGVGRDGFAWHGTATIARKAPWPRWTPPPEMIRRQPELKMWAAGMAGGPENPLGARALYLYQNGKDTLYRLHGTNEPDSIGQAVSSGCIRLLNADVIDLYGRVPIGSRVVVRDSLKTMA